MRNDFLAYCSRERNQLSVDGIEALSRELPGSHLLREHCLRILGDGIHHKNLSPYDHLRREIVVGRILGNQFANEDGLQQKLEKVSETRPSIAFAGLSIAWRDSAVLKNTHAYIRGENYRAGYLNWPDAAAVCCLLDSDEQFCNFVFRFVDHASDSHWGFLSYCVDPIVERIQRAPQVPAAEYDDNWTEFFLGVSPICNDCRIGFSVDLALRIL